MTIRRNDPGLTVSQLLTAEQLAERWQVPVSQVYRLTRNGQLPAVRIGRYYRYRIDVVEAWEERPMTYESAGRAADPVRIAVDGRKVHDEVYAAGRR